MYTVTVYCFDCHSGEPVSHSIACTSEHEARATVREELLWEGTNRVECAALGINEQGSFAR